MKVARYSVAMHGQLDSILKKHLLRSDGQEDICFALWSQSTGEVRTTAIIRKIILPEEGDRNVHGNASFLPKYLERVLAEAVTYKMGICLLHSHPSGTGWQRMSEDDIATELYLSRIAFGATSSPLLGMTLSGNNKWSARVWTKSDQKKQFPTWCGSVRVVGDKFDVGFNDDIFPVPVATGEQLRTVSSWGNEVQQHFARLKFVIVGAGSVGGFIAEGLARMGAKSISVVDFDKIEKHNLDRLCYADRSDVGKPKVEVLCKYLNRIATASDFQATPINSSLAHEEGLAATLDGDIAFSCVDRPLGRHILNQIAYAHLIPVIDGGISIRVGPGGTMKSADWRSHIATVGRPCLCCIGQYDTGSVQSEREGLLDDPSYIKGLPSGHPYKASENVFVFSMACATDMLLQFFAYFVCPVGFSNMGMKISHFVGGINDPARFSDCESDCYFLMSTGEGDKAVNCTNIS